jgi:hypothetical protein
MQALHDRGDDVVWQDRFPDDTGGMQVRQRRVCFCDDDDRETAGVRGDFLPDRETVDVRQENVQDDRIDADLLLEDRHRFEAVSRFPRRESAQPQGEAHQAPQVVVFFNDQDGLVADRHCWTAIRSWTGRSLRAPPPMPRLTALFAEPPDLTRGAGGVH